MNNKFYIGILVLVAVVSAGLTKYFFPKVEYKNVEVVKEVVKNDIKTVIRTVERPDGTKETVSETTDKSSKIDSSYKEIQIAAKPQWMFDVGARTKFDGTLNYDLQVQRRILGPFFIGAKASTDKSYGLSVGMEF